MNKIVMAVDIGGSKLAVGLVDAQGRVLHSDRFPWRQADERSVVDTVIESCRKVLDGAGWMAAQLGGIGVNIPGLADPDKGIWVEACFSGIHDVPLGAILCGEFHIPAHLDNDVNNCALGEKRFGACKECTDFLWVTVSNGCGGALFLNNRLYGGIYNTAGEIGHCCVEETAGHLCGCGNAGCLEAEAAGPGIARRFLEAGGPASIGGECATAERIAALARSGEPIALAVYAKEGYYLGKAISCALNLLTPEKVIIGGGVSGAFDLFYPELMATVDKMTYNKATGHVSIERTALGADAALIGAASRAFMYCK